MKQHQSIIEEEGLVEILPTQPANGSNKILWFILSTVMFVLILVGQFLTTSAASINKSNEERLTKIEVRQGVEDQKMEDLKRWMESIDGKLDKVIEGQKKER
jgi:hypothetical protein